jgi:hypothetical protein
MKYLFVDTNIYTACAAQELDDHDLSHLQTIKSKMDSGELVLLLPEVIKGEVFIKISAAFKEQRDLSKIIRKPNPPTEGEKPYQKQKKEKSESMLDDVVGEANRKILEKINTDENEALLTVNELFGHSKCMTIKLSDKALLEGMKRASLHKLPSSVSRKRGENHYVKDNDCIVFEMLKEQFAELVAKSEGGDLIFCTNDEGFFKEEELHPSLIEDLCASGRRVVGYKNIVDVIVSELDVEMQEQEKQKQQFTEVLEDVEEKTAQNLGVTSMYIRPLTMSNAVVVDGRNSVFAYQDSNGRFAVSAAIPSLVNTVTLDDSLSFSRRMLGIGAGDAISFAPDVLCSGCGRAFTTDRISVSANIFCSDCLMKVGVGVMTK